MLGINTALSCPSDTALCISRLAHTIQTLTAWVAVVMMTLVHYPLPCLYLIVYEKGRREWVAAKIK